jgi:hypothetical protein
MIYQLMASSRVLLSHQTGSILLPQGETLLGRGLSCNIRFNDPGLSRRHLRITVESTSVVVEDLGSLNGTRINGESFEGSRELQDKDELQIGHRWLRLKIVSGPTDMYDEETQEGFEVISPTPAPASSAKVLPKIYKQNCPRCRELLAADSSHCPKCGHRLPFGRPRSITQQIKIPDIDRRNSPRHSVEIPLLYSSETLTFDAVARDLSLGGIFIASELLDPIGTHCDITMLPDGSPPVTFAGTVCHVIEGETGLGGHPPGLGIKFSEMTDESKRWLTVYIDQQLHACSSPDPG